MFEEEYSQYWKTIVDTMADGLMVVDSEGVIVSVNRAMEELSGYSKEELVGKACDILDCDACFKSRAEGHDKYCSLFKDLKVTRRKCTLRKKDGTRLHLFKNASVLRDSSDRVIGGVETWTDLSEVVAREQVISRLRKELSGEDGFHGILGKSPAMEQVFELISSAAQSEAPVIIYGDSGTGKELVASAIHKLGIRQKGPFIKVNCAALSESLLESELFGHVKGAFTGADRTRLGRFEAANGGDIFLDEIGDLPLSTQVKLLRVLQEKEIEKVGDHRPISIDVRILAATNKDLSRLMEEGSFREDLYYRIGVIPINLPPVRERQEDIPLLVETFINRIRLKTDKPISGMSKEALDVLLRYDWPGNVRELINVIEYAFVLCHDGEIMPNHLPARVTGKQPSVTPRRRALKKQPDDDERKRILEALAAAGGNQSKAAKMLGISRVTLWKRLKTYDIQVDRKVRG
ncbi:MAG: sigma 54-interacting transcriptional regulator [Deltaproteobacteria bacterium]|nr:MAG: sigma 54-interacting transcriptional regulator [Deltaproteobacteria bacterium]